MLVRLALEELAASGRFDFVVLQATMASVSFYEEMGFVRVGAVARYASEGTPLDALPLQGYRHWASADESQLEQFGDISYMMALKLSDLKKDPASKGLSKRLVAEWPEVHTSAVSHTSPSLPIPPHPSPHLPIPPHPSPYLPIPPHTSPYLEQVHTSAVRSSHKSSKSHRKKAAFHLVCAFQ